MSDQMKFGMSLKYALGRSQFRLVSCLAITDILMKTNHDEAHEWDMRDQFLF